MGEKERGGSCSDSYAESHEFFLIGHIEASPKRELYGDQDGRLAYQKIYRGKIKEKLELFLGGFGEQAVRVYARIVKSMEAGGGPVKVHINKTGFNLSFGRGFTL